jgi:DNA-binding response OmpR family regulator
VAIVLIVEDEPDLLLLLGMAFEAAGHRVGMAADGDAALRRLRAEAFDVVVLDVMMPVLDGWQVLGALQGDPSAPPVVVLSAADGAVNRSRAAELGAALFVSKPFVMARLVETVERIARPSDPEAR